MLKRIVLKNYRSCLRTSIDLHPNLSVLIGPNGSGKTNILQGVMLLNQMASGQGHAPGVRRLATTSGIEAIFGLAQSDARLKASVDSYANESNRDVILNTRQRWLFRTGRRRDRKFGSEIPLAAVAMGGPAMWHYRYYVGGNLERQRAFGHARHFRFLAANMPKWAATSFADVAKYCDGVRYYGASQFTNPGTCPTSFEIEREGEHRSLHRLPGHARILYSMYSASKSDANRRYAQFIEIVGRKGLRLIDGLSFREVRSSSTEYSVRVGGKVERRRRRTCLSSPSSKSVDKLYLQTSCQKERSRRSPSYST